MMKRTIAAQEALLLCTAIELTPQARQRLGVILKTPIDWKHLIDLAAYHDTLPLLSHSLNAAGLASLAPKSAIARIDKDYRATMYRSMRMSAELVKVVRAFRRDGIETICLKGVALAEEVYRNPLLRPAADMDVLVRRKDVAAAAFVLERLGFQRSEWPDNESHQFHEPPFYKPGAVPVMLELHWALDDPQLACFSEETIWLRARPFRLQGEDVLILSPEDNLVFLANHIPKHAGGTLKLLEDVNEVLRKYEHTLDWDYIITSARSWQVRTTVYYSLGRARDLLDAPVPAAPLRALRPSRWRRAAINLLSSEGAFVSPIQSEKLRSETSALARALMMDHASQTLLVLSRHRGAWKRASRLRSVLWAAVVFCSAIGRTVATALSRAGRSRRPSKKDSVCDSAGGEATPLLPRRPQKEGTGNA